MSTDVTTTQKIRTDLTARLEETEKANPKTIEESIDNAWRIAWIRRKLAFFSGPHREHNPEKYQPVQFERSPDEGLL